jgi:L,D-peptidoglycan transpeptidase YkuD (ErfK/YbiS/YcfS/YnhG family)
MEQVAKNSRFARIALAQPPNSVARGKPDRQLCLDRLIATRIPGQKVGRLHAGPLVLRCAIGAAGVKRDKREGDRASPAGSWRLLSAFYRPDKPLTKTPRLPMRLIRQSEGWCDDSDSPLYNRRVVAPFRQSHENLWRDDHLYDIVIVLDYNFSPRRKRRGSAIFIHCARPGFTPTDGCVALRYDDLRRLLPRLSNRTVLTIR